MMHERTGYSVLREIKQAQTNDYSVADLIPNLLKKLEYHQKELLEMPASYDLCNTLTKRLAKKHSVDNCQK